MDDLISRKAAIDALTEYGNGRAVFISVGEAVIRMEQLPSAQPELKKGRWIEYEQEFVLEESLETVQKTVRECSVCTAKIAGMVGIMNYCPNCGARMEGVHETNRCGCAQTKTNKTP